MSPPAAPGRWMEAAFACDDCRHVFRVPIDRPRDHMECPECGKRFPIEVGAEVVATGDLRRCLVCGLDRLYRQKDFNKKLGIGIFVVAAILSVPTWGLSILAATLLDAGLYFMLGDVVICYRCEVQYRGFNRSPEHASFDLHVAEAIDNEPRAV